MAATSPRKEIFTGEMPMNWMASPQTLLRDQIDLGSDSAVEGKETSSNQGCDCCYCNSKSHRLDCLPGPVHPGKLRLQR